MTKPTITETKERSYFETRIFDELGVSSKENKIKLRNTLGNYDKETIEDIFSEDGEGNIRILLYDLDREPVQYKKKKGNKINESNSEDFTPYFVTRLKEPQERTDKNGKKWIQRYVFPTGVPHHPFLHPSLLAKYEAKTEIETLVLTEGYFKAFKGCMHGIDTVGLGSITLYKEKDTGELYQDILSIIKTCKVKNVIMLYDAACKSLKPGHIETFEDLAIRPLLFADLFSKIKELLKDYANKYNLSIYWANVKPECLEGNPKGLDDLLVAMKGSEFEVTTDLLQYSKPSLYFEKINCTASTNKIYKHLHIGDVDEFYNYHQEQIKEQRFVFRGTVYFRAEGKDRCEIEIPREAKNYFRVGDTYYKFIPVPNQYNQLEMRYDRRQKSTITDDYGTNFTKHIAKYNAFCNVPNHENYAQVIHNCFNVYYKFEFEPETGDFSNTIDFIKHIFGEQYELGLDYIQLLYQEPCQMLPILCLVSKENNTGKSTFGKYLRALFSNNATAIGNSDLSNDFNAFWTTKLLIICEETLIDKQATTEKIKYLSTENKAIVNGKGKDQFDIPFFGKFIFCSNNEDNFIKAGINDERFWVRKISKPKKDNFNLLNYMIDEIPAFLYFLSNRTMHTQKSGRIWFNPIDLRTQALLNLIERNKPMAEKTIVGKIKEMFLNFNVDVLELSLEYIKTNLLNNTVKDERYIKELLEVNLKVDKFRNSQGKYDRKKIKIPIEDAEGQVTFLRTRSSILSNKSII